MRFLFKTTKAEDFHSSGIRAPYQITLSGFAIQLFKCSRHSFMLRFMKAYNKTSFFKQCCDLPLCSENGRQQNWSTLTISGRDNLSNKSQSSFEDWKISSYSFHHILLYICWVYLTPSLWGLNMMQNVFHSSLPAASILRKFSPDERLNNNCIYWYPLSLTIGIALLGQIYEIDWQQLFRSKVAAASQQPRLCLP